MHISDCTVPLTYWYSKLDPLATHIQTISQSICIPSSNVSINEMIARFSGRSAYTVRIKNNPLQKVIKFFLSVMLVIHILLFLHLEFKINLRFNKYQT